MSDFLSGARAGLGLYSGYQSARAQSRAKYGAELDEAEARMAPQMELLAANFGDGKGGIDPAKVRASDASFQQYGALLKDLANNPHLRNRILPKGYEFENAVPVGEGKFAISLRNSETGESGIPLSTKGAKGGDDVVVHTPDSLIALGNELYRTIGARGVNATRAADQLSAANAALIAGEPAPDSADGARPAYMDYADKVYGPVRQALRGGSAPEVPEASVAPAAPTPPAEEGDFKSALGARESSGNYAADRTNKDGRRFVGKYQFGEARLKDAVAAGAVPKGTSLDDLKSNPQLQEQLMDWHEADYRKRIVADGLDKNLVDPNTGEPLTIEGLVAAAHLGGYGGMRKYMRGGYNPADELGTKIGDYAKKFSGGIRGTGPETAEQQREKIAQSLGVTSIRGQSAGHPFKAPEEVAADRARVAESIPGQVDEFASNLGGVFDSPGAKAIGESVGAAVDTVTELAKKIPIVRDIEAARKNKRGVFSDEVQSAPAADAAALPPEQKQEVARGSYLHFEKEAQAVAEGAAPKTNTKPALARAMRPDAAVKDINRVLGNMVSLGYLTPQQAVTQSISMQNAAATTRASMVKDYAAADKSTAEARGSNAESASKSVLELAKGTALSFFRTNEKGVVQSILGGADLGKMKTEEQAILLVANMKENLLRVTTLSQEQQQRMMLILNGSVPITPADEFLFTHALKEMAKHVSREQRFSTKGAGSVALDQEYNAVMR
ncbi:hypothetical protein [uncultured Halomonas sp.]|uniref:hypothetical protein n=1 Tax=uncultured Halomonas sp. TaxID=173971 RepID=UPI0026240511|nr:hypothetical protein [uncultured Halomonas sp.]